MVIGRDINVVAGMCTLIGHCSASASLWSVNYFMTGAIATVMSGTLTFIGGNNIGANWMQVQAGHMVNFGTCKWAINIDLYFFHSQNCNGMINMNAPSVSYLFTSFFPMHSRWNNGDHRIWIYNSQGPTLP